jgi:hypothetical protein
MQKSILIIKNINIQTYFRNLKKLLGIIKFEFGNN